MGRLNTYRVMFIFRVILFQISDTFGINHSHSCTSSLENLGDVLKMVAV